MTRKLAHIMRRWLPTELCCLVCRRFPIIHTGTSAEGPHLSPTKPLPLGPTAAAAATRASGVSRRAMAAVMSLAMARR